MLLPRHWVRFTCLSNIFPRSVTHPALCCIPDQEAWDASTYGAFQRLNECCYHSGKFFPHNWLSLWSFSQTSRAAFHRTGPKQNPLVWPSYHQNAWAWLRTRSHYHPSFRPVRTQASVPFLLDNPWLTIERNYF
jgi:hypothetical protein